jgi:hypothetical protein
MLKFDNSLQFPTSGSLVDPAFTASEADNSSQDSAEKELGET